MACISREGRISHHDVDRSVNSAGQSHFLRGLSDTVEPPTEGVEELQTHDRRERRCEFVGCNKTFKRPSDLARHIHNVHYQRVWFWCPIKTCHRSAYFEDKARPFLGKDKRNEHVRKVHNEEPDLVAFDAEMENILEDLVSDDHTSERNPDTRDIRKLDLLNGQQKQPECGEQRNTDEKIVPTINLSQSPDDQIRKTAHAVSAAPSYFHNSEPQDADSVSREGDLIHELPAESSKFQAISNIRGQEREDTNSDADGVVPARLVIACKACARAKTKCDKKIPSCGRCEAKGIICESRPSVGPGAAFRLARPRLHLYNRPITINLLPVQYHSPDHDARSKVSYGEEAVPMPTRESTLVNRQASNNYSDLRRGSLYAADMRDFEREQEAKGVPGCNAEIREPVSGREWRYLAHVDEQLGQGGKGLEMHEVGDFGPEASVSPSSSVNAPDLATDQKSGVMGSPFTMKSATDEQSVNGPTNEGRSAAENTPNMEHILSPQEAGAHEAVDTPAFLHATEGAIKYVPLLEFITPKEQYLRNQHIQDEEHARSNDTSPNLLSIDSKTSVNAGVSPITPFKPLIWDYTDVSGEEVLGDQLWDNQNLEDDGRSDTDSMEDIDQDFVQGKEGIEDVETDRRTHSFHGPSNRINLLEDGAESNSDIDPDDDGTRVGTGGPVGVPEDTISDLEFQSNQPTRFVSSPDRFRDHDHAVMDEQEHTSVLQELNVDAGEGHIALHHAENQLDMTIPLSLSEMLGSGDDVDSERSFDRDSVPPVALTTITNTSYSSGEADDFFVQELSNFMWADLVLRELCCLGVGDAKIGQEKFRRNFCRLLKQFALDLKLEANTREHLRAATFISGKSGAVSRHICVRAAGPKTAQQDPKDEKEQEDRGDYSEESEDDPAGEDEECNLAQLKQFIGSSFAFKTLRENLRNFVQPTFQSKFGELVRLARDELSLSHHYAPDWIRTCMSEVRCADPSVIKISSDIDKSWINNLKVFIEKWTRELWDWWPLVPAQHPLDAGQTCLKWVCICGEERWTEVPEGFANRLSQLLGQFANGTKNGNAAGTNSSARRPNHCAHDPAMPSAHIPSGPTSDAHFTSSSSLQMASTPLTPLTTTREQPGPQRVLLVVSTGADHHLAQISVQDLSSLEFFKRLRSKYFKLRGFWRRYFSVRRYHHCDFYKCERFDEHEYAPRLKDQYPEVRNPDYMYIPKPVKDMPPISEHEFYKRFYSSGALKLFLRRNPFHRYRKCKCTKCCKTQRKEHCREVVGVLPKKLSQLDENSDQREFFWGIYARERVCALWVLFYNLFCTLPMLWFFFMWIFKWGHVGDLQDAAVPVTMTVSMISTFWSIFLGTGQFWEG